MAGLLSLRDRGRLGLNSMMKEDFRSEYNTDEEIALGRTLSESEAGELENRLISYPNDFAARVRLVSYYYQNKAAGSQLVHILWMIDTHPDLRYEVWINPQFALTSTKHLSANEVQSYVDHWLKQTEYNWSCPLVLSNAGHAIRLVDRLESIRLFERAQELDPLDVTIPVALATCYYGLLHEPNVSLDTTEKALRCALTALNLGKVNHENSILCSQSFMLEVAAEAAVRLLYLDQAVLATEQLYSLGKEQLACNFEGRIAVRRFDLEAAEQLLYRSVKCSKSNPRLELAQELVDAGRQESVRQFLSMCLLLPLTQRASERIQNWINQIDRHETPKLSWKQPIE